MESKLKLNVEILDNGSVVRSDVEDVIVPNHVFGNTTKEIYKNLGNKIGENVIDNMIPHIEESHNYNFDIEVKIKSKHK